MAQIERVGMPQLYGSLEGSCESRGLDSTFSSSGSATGNTLTEAFLSLFKSLIEPLIISLDPNLNPGEMNPVTSVIKALLNITVIVPNKDLDEWTTIPIDFKIDTSTIQPPFNLGITTVVGKTSASALTSTSASFGANLGLLKQQLNNLIPKLEPQVEAVQIVD